MRKFFCILFSVLLLSSPALAAEGPAQTDLAPGCAAAVLMERETGTVLFAKNEHERLSPASVTKVMTLLLVCEALDRGQLDAGEIVTASPRAASMGGSQIWLKEGEQMTVAEMVKCVAVVSANDCAVALAERLCGSEEAFTALMNRRAGELGMNDTHFTNCTGLFEDGDHYTSALDVAVMSRELLGHDYIRQFTSIWTDSIRGGSFGLSNTNKLVRYYEGCTGLKTGFTAKAMFCLSASAMRQGTEYIAVVLHGETSQRRFDDARAMLDYAFANYALVRPEPDAPLRVPVRMGRAGSVEAVAAESGAVVVEKSLLAALEARTELPESVTAPVEAGQSLGALVLTAGGRETARVGLIAAEGVERLSVPDLWRALVRALCRGEVTPSFPETRKIAGPDS